jgi:hypothetical protein
MPHTLADAATLDGDLLAANPRVGLRVAPLPCHLGTDRHVASSDAPVAWTAGTSLRPKACLRSPARDRPEWWRGSVSRSCQTGGHVPRRVDPVVVALLAGLVGLLAVFRAALDVGSTALVVGIAGIVGAVAGGLTRPHEHRHGLLLLVVVLVPMIGLVRLAGPYGLVWFLAVGAGAILGRSYTRGSPPAGSTTTPRIDEAQREQAGRDLRWMLVILAGLLLPLGAALTVGASGAPVAVRLAVVLTALVVTDAPLVVAGVRGKGAVGVVQPWRWPAYLGWFVIRLLLLLPAVFVPWNG